jgi:hypothetical protein
VYSSVDILTYLKSSLEASLETADSAGSDYIQDTCPASNIVSNLGSGSQACRTAKESTNESTG